MSKWSAPALSAVQEDGSCTQDIRRLVEDTNPHRYLVT